MAESRDKQAERSDAQSGDQSGSARDQTNVPASQEERYDRHGWRERARTRFGISPHALAGALYDADDEQLSEAQVRSKVDSFLSREVGPS